MNLMQLMALPWHATSRRAAIWIGSLLAVILAAFACLAPFAGAAWGGAVFGVCVVINLIVWVALLPNSMILSRDARLLRIPRLERDAVASLVVHALLLIVLPPWLFTMAPLEPLPSMLAIAVCAALAMAYACLPAYFAALIVFAWLALNSAGREIAIALAGRHAFSGWAMATLLILAALIAWSWRRVVRDGIDAGSAHAPMILKLRMNVWNASRSSAGVLERQRFAGLRPRADLRDTGPGHATRAIRVAIGGLFLPQRWTSRLRVALFAVLAVGFYIFAIAPVQFMHGTQGWHALAMPRFWGRSLAAGVGFASAMLVFTCLMRLRRLWTGANGELSLLALLPGLGSRAALLRALLLPPLVVQLAIMAFTLGIALALHAAPGVIGWMLLGPLGAYACYVAYALGIAGDRVPNLFANVVVAVCGIVLVGMSEAVVSPGHAAARVASVLGYGWLALGVAMAWLGWRGWCGLLARPHPFLAASARA